MLFPGCVVDLLFLINSTPRGTIVESMKALRAGGFRQREGWGISLHMQGTNKLEVCAFANTRCAGAHTTSALQEGSPAPDVMLTLQDGFQLPISAEHGKLVALYFCSPETSPECIREANGLRDHWAELHLRHVVVIGVSPRDAASHRAFIAEHRLPFDLVSDADGRIAGAYKVPALGDYGPQTYLVGRDGKLRKAWLTTNPESRAQEILDVAAD